MCAASGLSVGFAFWPYRTGFIAYFVLVPFIIFSGLRDGRGRWLLNTPVFGFCYFLGSLYWIAMLDREQIAFPWLRIPAAVVLCLYLSLFMLLAGFVTRRLVRARRALRDRLRARLGRRRVPEIAGAAGFSRGPRWATPRPLTRW